MEGKDWTSVLPFLEDCQQSAISVGNAIDRACGGIELVKNEAGAVARAITTIGDFGFNMRTLRSRPQKKLAWSYYFYIEGEGNLDTVTGVNMLKALKENCEIVKVLGNYPKDVILE